MKAKPAKTADQVLALYFPVAEAVAALLHPHAEVVIHDLDSDRIVKIWNAFSRRKPGDASYLGHDPDLLDVADTYGPYEKAHDDGSRLKSVSAVLRAPDGEKLGFLCINLDLSKLDAAVALLSAFGMPAAQLPEPLFRHDWRERINLEIRTFLQEQGTSLKALDRNGRMALLASLEAKGLFETRNAAPFVAETLGISRASVYGLLAVARETAQATTKGKRRS
ncbi:MAG TPA: PAS domain-containing protein [Terriglobales bacterium]|nr:PAS domain-containing protein [Terriglobales bacterium]